jgi:hypothetical protein
LAIKDPDFYLVDFKCGEDDNKEPIRWSYNDILKGSNGKYKFVDCLLMKCTMKLDLVYFFNNFATEITENYYLEIGNQTNFKKPMIDTKKIIKNLIIAYNENIENKKYFKALKRMFSIQSIEKRPSKQLVDLFNSELGLLYKCIANIKTIVLLLEQTFKVVPIDRIIENLQLIKYNASKIVNCNVNISDDIDKICKLDRNKMKGQLEQLCDKLDKIINENCKQYLIKIA